MIILTRLNGPAFAVNPDLVERAESTPDTVVTLVDGSKYLVTETLEDLIEKVRDFRASVVYRSVQLEQEAENPPPAALRPLEGGRATARDSVVPFNRREI